MAEAAAAMRAATVLVVQHEPAERDLTANHLRQSGFETIEVADFDEARRVLDERRVDVVFADLEMPGSTQGISALRLVREHHPGTKTILTSGAEPDIAAAERYGIFLSKPYRMVDLDHCLQRALAGATTSANQMRGSLRGNPGQTVPGANKIPVRSLRPETSPDPGTRSTRGDELSTQWADDLSRQLAERAAQQHAVDPAAAKAARRDALKAYDRSRARRLRLVLGFAIGAAAGSAIVILAAMSGVSFDSLSASRPQPDSSVAMADAVPASIPSEAKPTSSAPRSPSPIEGKPPSEVAKPAAQRAPAPLEPTTPPGPPSSSASAEPVTAGQPASGESASNQGSLERDEVKEVQTRLRWFGFNPGPVDGAAGAMTTRAVMRYQQARGQPQTGTIDRELLAQLREDPSPQATRRDLQASRSYPPRRSDPFEPMRAAGERVGHWLNSMLR